MVSPHSHGHYEIYFLLSGERDFFIDNSLFTLGENTVVVIPPFTMHKTEGGEFERVNVNVSEDYFSESEAELLSHLASRRIIRLSPHRAQLMRDRLNELSICFSSSGRFKKTVLHSLMMSVLCLLLDEVGSSVERAESVATKKVPDTLLKIIRFLSESYGEKITLESVAGKFFISKSYVAKLFATHARTSFNDYLTKLRMNKAKELLSLSNKSVEEISFLTGFSSANYFGLVFKRETGLSPLAYRKLEVSKR